MSDAAWLEGADGAAVTQTPNRAGFTLNFAGLAAMLLGIAAFLWGHRLPFDDMSRYVWREVAGVALGVALPMFLLGIVHALPGRAWSRALAYGGLGACAAGLVAFSWLYPYLWNVAGRDLSPYGIVPYGAGVVLLGASAFMGLLDSYLDRRSGKTGAWSRESEAPVTEEEVMRDIEEQSRRRHLSWGGMDVEDAPSIVLNEDAGGLVALNGGVGRRFTLLDQDTSTEVDRLLAFRGAKDAAQEDMESQADALLRLREHQRTRRADRKVGSRLSRWLAKITGR